MTRQASLFRARKSPKKLGMSCSNNQLPSLRVPGLATSRFAMASSQHLTNVDRMYQVMTSHYGPAGSGKGLATRFAWNRSRTSRYGTAGSGND